MRFLLDCRLSCWDFGVGSVPQGTAQISFGDLWAKTLFVVFLQNRSSWSLSLGTIDELSCPSPLTLSTGLTLTLPEFFCHWSWGLKFILQGPHGSWRTWTQTSCWDFYNKMYSASQQHYSHANPGEIRSACWFWAFFEAVGQNAFHSCSPLLDLTPPCYVPSFKSTAVFFGLARMQSVPSQKMWFFVFLHSNFCHQPCS